MNVILLLNALLVGFLGQATATAQVPRVTASQAQAHIGERATVCGKVTSTYFASQTPGQPTFINFGKPVPDQEFSIVIWGESRAEFGAPEKTYQEGEVCVTGLVESFRDKPRITATDPVQIKILNQPAEERPASRESSLSDAAIRKILIQKSIAAYGGSCPCPYNLDRAGRRCGRRSAYSRPGGASPLCYDHDISDQMIRNYRKRDR